MSLVPTPLDDLLINPWWFLIKIAMGSLVDVISAPAAERARTEGEKEGYLKASREYESKLRAQAEEFFTQLEALREEIRSTRIQRDQAQEIAKEAFTLLGKFEGCINAGKENGHGVDEETRKCYIQLKEITDKVA